jgi:hypothetical protein
LHAIWSSTNTNGYSDSLTHCERNTNSNGRTERYTYGNNLAERQPQTYPYGEIPSNCKSKTYSAAAPHPCATATITAAYSLAATNVAASHHTRTASTVAPTYCVAAAQSVA